MENLQDVLDQMASGHAEAAPGEYEGPVTVRHGGTFDGHGATLWVAKGPALIVDTEGATIRNLRIEVVGDPVQDVAIVGGGHTIMFENVEVHGGITGVPGVAEDWHLPSGVALGDFAPDETNVVCASLELPEEVALECRMDGVRAEPAHLAAGHAGIRLTIDGMRAGTTLYGDLLLRTGGVVRRIYVSGRSLKGAAKRMDQLPADCDARKAAQEEGTSENANHGALSRETGTRGAAVQGAHDRKRRIPPSPSARGSVVLNAVHGQRVLVQDDVLTIRYEDGGRPSGMDIDAYVFSLYGNGKTRSDDDLFFFGHRDGEAVALTEQSGVPDVVQLTLSKVPEDVQHLIVSYAIYDDGSTRSFSAVRAPVVRVTGAGQEAVFPLAGLSVEKTVVAVDIYRRNGAWKVHFVGAGYAAGLVRLCESYGLEVEG